MKLLATLLKHGGLCTTRLGVVLAGCKALQIFLVLLCLTGGRHEVASSTSMLERMESSSQDMSKRHKQADACTSTTKQVSFDSLAPEVKLKIFSYLDKNDLLLVTYRVSTKWRTLSLTATLWRSLDLRGMTIPTAAVLGVLANGQLLKQVAISGRSDDKELMQAVVGGCRQLEKLSLDGVKIYEGDLWYELAENCKEIAHVELRNTFFSGEPLFNGLSEFEKLKTLVLHNELQFLHRSPHDWNLHLTELTLLSPVLADYNMFEILGKLRSTLVKLTFDGLNVSDHAYASLALCKKLELVHINRAWFINVVGMVAGLGALCNLKSVRVHWGIRLTNNAIKCLLNLPSAVEQLTSLDLSSTRTNDSIVSYITRKCPHLTHLNLSKCVLVTDVGLQTIMSSCPSLSSLDIRGIRRITAASLPLVRSRPDLQVFHEQVGTGPL